MVACPNATYEELLPILKSIGKPLFCGEAPGLGQTMKLVNNLVSVTALAVSCESPCHGRQGGA